MILRRATGAASKYRFRWQCQNATTTNNINLRPNDSGSRQPFSVLDFVSVSLCIRNRNYLCNQETCVIEVNAQWPRCRYISVDASPNTSTGNNNNPPPPGLVPVKKGGRHEQRSLRSYQKKANVLLEQVKTSRIQSSLVAQKVEELLLLSLSEYDNNIPSDGPLALELLNTALRYAKGFATKENGGEKLLPRLFSLACQMMIRSGHYRATNDVHRQLWRLLDCHEHYFVANDTLYNTHHVNDVCSYFIRSVVMDANKRKRKLSYRKTRQLYQLVERLGELQRDPSVPIESNPYMDDSLIMLLCNQLKPNDAHEILRGRVENSSSAAPLVSSFVTIINGYAKTFQPDKALSVVEWMMSAQNESKSSPPSSSSTTTATTITTTNNVVVPPPNTSCFNGLLHAYALAGGKDAGFKAEKAIEWMQEIRETKNVDTKPNETTYNICINAWARSKHPEAPFRAENILRQIVALSEAGNPIEPSEEAFTAVMNTWINSSSSHGNNHKRVKEATERVTGILNLMERISDNSQRISMSVIPYTVLIKAWEKVAQQSRGVEKQKCGEDIIKVVERMREKKIAPTTEVYNSILTALSETAAINAVLYFLELEEEYCRGQIQLDTRTFNCGLNAIAALNRPDAVKRATEILKRMFKYHETDPSILPSNLTFNIILKVLSKSTSHIPNAAAKADALLSEMDAMQSVIPDFISYVTCIIAWGRSDEKDKIKRVTDLLHRFISSMEDNPDGTNNRAGIAVFNAVLSVCHHNSSPEHYDESLRAAQVTMKELRKAKGIVPDQITYASFFRVVKEGVPGDHSPTSSFLTLVEEEFNQCARYGYTTRDVIMALHMIAPETLFTKLVGENSDPRTFAIRKAWCRNVTRH